MPATGRRGALLTVLLLAAAGCGGEVTEEDVVDRYLAWQEDVYGGLADQRVQRVSSMAEDGPCLAAEIVEERGHQVTVFLRDGAVVEVVNGHVGDRLDGDDASCGADL